MAKGITLDDDFPAKFSKLLPAEVTALYLSLRPFLMDGNPYFHFFITITCLICAVLFIKISRGVDNWLHVAIYAMTFVIWVFTLEPAGFKFFLDDQWHLVGGTERDYGNGSAVVAILWTFVISNLFPNRIVAS